MNPVFGQEEFVDKIRAVRPSMSFLIKVNRMSCEVDLRVPFMKLS